MTSLLHFNDTKIVPYCIYFIQYRYMHVQEFDHTCIYELRDCKMHVSSCDFLLPSQVYVEDQLRMPWNWLVGVMDSTEAQLRFGTALVSSTDSSSPNHPMNPSYGRQTDTVTVSSRGNTSGRAALSWAQRRQRAAATIGEQIAIVIIFHLLLRGV